MLVTETQLKHSQMETAALGQRLFQLRRNGFCVLENVVPKDRCDEIRNSVMKTVRVQHANFDTGRIAAANKLGHTPSVINYDQSYAEYLADDRLMDMIGRLLGEHVRISFTTAIINHPGNSRGGWHADWPFNQTNAGRIRAPYPDAVMHITTLWMLSPFHTQNGGTLVLPGSHRRPTNPTADGSFNPHEPIPDEINICGSAGSVLVMDSRLWHATAPNRTDESRVALAVRYAPWWLNLEVLRPDSEERLRMCDEMGKSENVVPSVRAEVYHRLPRKVQPLYRHWVQ